MSASVHRDILAWLLKWFRPGGTTAAPGSTTFEDASPGARFAAAGDQATFEDVSGTAKFREA